MTDRLSPLQEPVLDRRYLSPDERLSTVQRYQTATEDGTLYTINDLVEHADLMDELLAGVKRERDELRADRDDLLEAIGAVNEWLIRTGREGTAHQALLKSKVAKHV